MITFKHFTKLYRFSQFFNFATIKKFNLPDLGQKIKQGTIKKWYVKQGDTVIQFQKIADIASDKQFTELTAIDSGKIHKIYHKQQQICQVGQLLLQLQTKQTQNTESNNAQTKVKQQIQTKEQVKIQKKVESPSQTSQNNNQILATPAVRHLIKQNKINPKDIKATGKQGRITKQDVLNYIQKQKNKNISQPVKQTKIQSFGKNQQSKTISMNGFQKGMQKTMTQSNKIPTLYLHDQIDITKLAQVREKIKKVSNKSITFMSFFVKSFSLALKQHAILNSNYNPDKPFEYVLYQNHNITIAIDTPNGLAVPNIKNVQQLSILQIQDQINRLRKISEEGKLLKKDLQNGTICISNIGTVGGTYAGPLILPPQVAIVAIGKTLRLPRFESQTSQKVISKRITPISFGCDHRVIDGGTIAKFINKWKSYLQNPETMLIHLK